MGGNMRIAVWDDQIEEVKKLEALSNDYLLKREINGEVHIIKNLDVTDMLPI